MPSNQVPNINIAMYTVANDTNLSLAMGGWHSAGIIIIIIIVVGDQNITLSYKAPQIIFDALKIQNF